MIRWDELERLEGVVSRLLAGYKELRYQNSSLMRDIRERDELINRLQLDLATDKRQRSAIDARITSLIKKITQWEGEVAEADSHLKTVESAEKGMQGNLFADLLDGNKGKES